jgi:hypothetical protein
MRDGITADERRVHSQAKASDVVQVHDWRRHGRFERAGVS